MSTEFEHAPRVSRAIMRRAIKLLYMEYKPSELAEVIGITPKTIYDTYIPAGLPHRRDAGGNIWIIGTQFIEWANATLEKGKRYASQKRAKLGDNQAYCVKCRKATDFKEITRRITYSKHRVMLYGICSECGGRMTTIKRDINDKP